MKEYTELCVTAQKNYCNEKHKPLFIDHDGRCGYCGRDIFSPTLGGYKLEQAGNTLITSCPYCRKTFCD